MTASGKGHAETRDNATGLDYIDILPPHAYVESSLPHLCVDWPSFSQEVPVCAS